jgi:hypothetical protein
LVFPGTGEPLPTANGLLSRRPQPRCLRWRPSPRPHRRQGLSSGAAPLATPAAATSPAAPAGKSRPAAEKFLPPIRSASTHSHS